MRYHDSDDAPSVYVTRFDLRKPCSNCPFRKKGAIELRPGRVEGIIRNLLSDHNVFPCHKTTDTPRDAAACMGALSYMYDHYGVFPILARFAVRSGELRMDDLVTAQRHLRDKLTIEGDEN